MFDAVAVREGVEAEVIANGLDPANVDVRMTSAILEVQDLAIRDDGGTGVGPSDVDTVSAVLDLEGGQGLFSASGENAIKRARMIVRHISRRKGKALDR